MTTQTNETIFKSEDFCIPKTYGDKDFVSFIKATFEIFQSNLSKFNGRLKESLTKNETQIDKLCKSIIASIEYYLDGNIIKAYSILGTGLDQIKNHLLISNGPTKLESLTNVEEFYRARIGNGQHYLRKEMFHIPFEKRYLVNSQRYSLPGLPCLYLANSTYLCWEELGRPDYDKLQFSRVDLSAGNFKFLNLNHTNNAIVIPGFDSDGDMNIYSDFFVIRYLSTWPLQAAASIIVNNRNATFKPEYIIPQLLLQWIKNAEDIDGVRYFSTRAVGTTPILFFGNLANIVIPIKKTKPKGLCDELAKRVLLTNPISYEYASLLNPQFTLDKVDPDNHKETISMKPITINLTGDNGQLYVNSKFGQLERLLQEMKADRVQE